MRSTRAHIPATDDAKFALAEPVQDTGGGTTQWNANSIEQRKNDGGLGYEVHVLQFVKREGSG